MAVVKGTNAGFVTTAPIGNPFGTALGIDFRARAVKDTSPTTAIKITEIGWWCDNATEAANMDIGIYDHDIGLDEPDNLIEKVTLPKGTTFGWKRATGLNITITGDTIYWIAAQVDDTATETDTDLSAEVGSRLSFEAAVSELPASWAALGNVDDFINAIYAVFETPPIPPPKAQGGSKQPHDFKRFPELTNNQMQTLYFDSPHKQITENFTARVMKVTDGDTIRVKCDFRDFDFPIRLAGLAAPERNEEGGKESQSWLERQILGETVDIILSKSRVEKWGRLLADVFHRGMSMSEDSVRNGHGVRWEDRAAFNVNPRLEVIEFGNTTSL